MREKGLAVVVLAAGKGTRMKSPQPKVLQPLSSRTLLHFVLDAAEALRPQRLIVVVGFQAESVRQTFRDRAVEFVDQKEQLGTGHAAWQTQGALRDFEGDVLVLSGDMPFLRTETLKTLVRRHRETGAACTLLTLKTRESKDFGRILRDSDGSIQRIVEVKDATPAEKSVDEFNAGVYCFDKDLFFKALMSIDNRNVQKEFYLTDTIKFLVQNRYRVGTVQTEDAEEIFGINSQEDLNQAERLLSQRNPSA